MYNLFFLHVSELYPDDEDRVGLRYSFVRSLMRLPVRENVIEFIPCETFKTYI
jgi:hypothetical protein